MDGAKTAGDGNNQVLEAKLIVGRFIDFTRPNWPGGAPPAAQIPALFATQPQQLLNIGESTGVFTKTSSVTAGAHANVNKPWRTFNFLSWLPGSISEVQTGTDDVLTGPMSGCDLVLYNRLGNRCAGHLGTDVSVTPGDTRTSPTYRSRRFGITLLRMLRQPTSSAVSILFGKGMERFPWERETILALPFFMACTHPPIPFTRWFFSSKEVRRAAPRRIRL